MTLNWGFGYLRLGRRRGWEGQDWNGRRECAGGSFSTAKGTTTATAGVASQEGELSLFCRSSRRSHWAWHALTQLSPSLPPLCALLVHHVRLAVGYQDSTRSLWVSQISLLHVFFDIREFHCIRLWQIFPKQIEIETGSGCREVSKMQLKRLLEPPSSPPPPNHSHSFPLAEQSPINSHTLENSCNGHSTLQKFRFFSVFGILIPLEYGFLLINLQKTNLLSPRCVWHTSLFWDNRCNYSACNSVNSVFFRKTNL